MKKTKTQYKEKCIKYNSFNYDLEFKIQFSTGFRIRFKRLAIPS